jgi:hypothetical protein
MMPIYESKEKFIKYLTEDYIPKLKFRGFFFTADQFEEAVYWLLKGEQDTEERAA